jgi:predicted DNA-binding protein (MmcQ/YjbR family)
MTVRNAGDQIKQAVLSWEYTEAHAHRFGGIEFRIGKRELSHAHGDVLVDIPSPKKVRDELVTNGAAEPHHVLPESGWVSFYIRKPEDVGRAIGLLKRSYELAMKQKNPPSPQSR